MTERRRDLLEEILRARNAEIALTPAEESEPPGDSVLWPTGIIWQTVTVLHAHPDEKRKKALLIAAQALGWIEALDQQTTDAFAKQSPDDEIVSQ
jgi:hypothetical protein